ncbi:hypothetical protein INR49_015906 [Caranx melampygus]|nr:hypothetical protein INR49_015906 [Caranx melampygus]
MCLTAASAWSRFSVSSNKFTLCENHKTWWVSWESKSCKLTESSSEYVTKPYVMQLHAEQREPITRSSEMTSFFSVCCLFHGENVFGAVCLNSFDEREVFSESSMIRNTRHSLITQCLKSLQVMARHIKREHHNHCQAGLQDGHYFYINTAVKHELNVELLHEVERGGPQPLQMLTDSSSWHSTEQCSKKTWKGSHAWDLRRDELYGGGLFTLRACSLPLRRQTTWVFPNIQIDICHQSCYMLPEKW